MFMQLIPARLVTLYGNQIYRKISLLPSEIVKQIQNNVSAFEKSVPLPCCETGAGAQLFLTIHY